MNYICQYVTTQGKCLPLLLFAFFLVYFISATHIFSIPPSYRQHLILLLCTSTNQPRDFSFVIDEGGTKSQSETFSKSVTAHAHTHLHAHTHIITYQSVSKLFPFPLYKNCDIPWTSLSLQRHINIATHFYFANATHPGTHRWCALEETKILNVKIRPPSKMSNGTDTVTSASQ